MKNSTDRMLTRIKSIYLFIQEKGTVTTQELVDEFGITPRTVQRDLNVLAYNNLVKSPSRGKWTTTNKKVKISSLIEPQSENQSLSAIFFCFWTYSFKSPISSSVRCRYSPSRSRSSRTIGPTASLFK